MSLQISRGQIQDYRKRNVSTVSQFFVELKKRIFEKIKRCSGHSNSSEDKGHFEIDAVKGKNGKSETCIIITLIDRKSRYI